VFHDFKKQSIDEPTLKSWLTTIPLEALINKKGTTWRGLSAQDQAKANQANTAIELMMSHTSVIKRPIVVSDKNMFVGHDETLLNTLK
jgi:arsenate reductase-like glutaredoxin family protein